MILLRFLTLLIFVNIVFGKFDAPLPTKENFSVGEYLTEQFSKNGGYIPEKYDGPVYDDMNVVIENNVEEPFNPNLNDTSVEDEPRLFTFDPEEAPRFRGKRQSDFQQPSAPVRSSATGAAIVAHVDSTSDIVPYDAHVDPDFPAEAPVARGLKNVPEGWNLDKEIDYEFQRGYRKGGVNPSYSGHQLQQHGSGMESSSGSGGSGMMEGPYMDAGSSYAPQSMGGSSYGGGYGGGMNSGYGSMGSTGYSSMGSSGYGSIGNGYGSSYGGMSSGYGGLGSSGYGGMSNGGYGGLGNGYGSSGLGGCSGYSGGYGSSGGYGGLGGLGQGYGSSGYGGLGQGYGGYGGYGK